MKEHQERKASPFTIAVLHLKNALKELIEESRLHASSHADPDEVIQEMYNIIEDFALYAKDRDSTTVHITVKEAIAVVESALARRRFQLAVRAEPRGRSPYEQQPRQES